MSEALAPQGPSPLSEADPNSLNELIATRLNDIFNKPPLAVSDDDLRLMVLYYQKERQRFLKESQEKEAKPPRAKRATPQSVAEALSIAQADLL